MDLNFEVPETLEEARKTYDQLCEFLGNNEHDYVAWEKYRELRNKILELETKNEKRNRNGGSH